MQIVCAHMLKCWRSKSLHITLRMCCVERSLCRRLAVVLLNLEYINGRSKWQRALHYESDARTISSCKDDLQHVFQQFNVSITYLTYLEAELGHQVLTTIVSLRL